MLSLLNLATIQPFYYLTKFLAPNLPAGIGPKPSHLEPVVKVALVLVFTGIEHKQVQAALGKEELVRGMHNLLAAEVPDVEPNFLLCRLMLSRNTPLDNIDPLSSLFFWVVFI